MPGPCLEYLEHGLAVERRAGAQLALVFVKRILTPASEDRAVVDDRSGVVGRHTLHSDHSTLNADVPSAVLQKRKIKNKNKAEKLYVE